MHNRLSRVRIGLRTIKTVVAVIVAMVIVNFYGASPSKLLFAMLGAMAAVQPTFSASVEACVSQIVGVMFGALMGILLRLLPVLIPIVIGAVFFGVFYGTGNWAWLLLAVILQNITVAAGAAWLVYGGYRLAKKILLLSSKNT